MISSLPGLNSSKLDSVMESLQRQRMMEQQAQLHQAMQVLQNGKARCSPDQTAQERLSHDRLVKKSWRPGPYGLNGP